MGDAVALDLSGGATVFDFELEVEPWIAAGDAWRLPTQVLGGEWAIFLGQGRLYTHLDVSQPFEIGLAFAVLEPSEEDRIEFEIGCLGECVAAPIYEGLVQAFGDPLLGPANDLETGVIDIEIDPGAAQTVVFPFPFYGQFIIELNLPRGTFVDDITLVALPEPGGLFLVAGLGLFLATRRPRGHATRRQ